MVDSADRLCLPGLVVDWQTEGAHPTDAQVVYVGCMGNQSVRLMGIEHGTAFYEMVFQNTLFPVTGNKVFWNTIS